MTTPSTAVKHTHPNDSYYHSLCSTNSKVCLLNIHRPSHVVSSDASVLLDPHRFAARTNNKKEMTTDNSLVQLFYSTLSSTNQDGTTPEIGNRLPATP